MSGKITFTVKKASSGLAGLAGLVKKLVESTPTTSNAISGSLQHDNSASSSSDVPQFSAAASAAEVESDDDLDAFMSGVMNDLAAQEEKKRAKSANVALDVRAGAKSAGFNDDGPSVRRGERLDEEEVGAGYEGELIDDAEEEGGSDVEYDDDGRPIGGAVGSKRKRHDDDLDVLEAVDHSTIEYEPFERRFYSPKPEIAALSAAEITARRRELEVRVENVFNSNADTGEIAPVQSFMQLGFDVSHPALITAISRQGFEAPTPIQAQALPILLSGRDLIGLARTGSGKTLSYLLPLLRHVLDQRHLSRGEGPIGVILAPTRELAQQIYDVCRKFCKALDLNCVLVSGGTSKWEQTKALKAGAEIVIATPGRLIDHVRDKQSSLSMQRVTFLIVDEADRMLDLGFAPQVYALLGRIRPDRQTAMFSATFPRWIEMLAREALSNPVRISVGQEGQASEDIVQRVNIMDPTAKWLWLANNLASFCSQGKVLIFVSAKAAAEQLAASINSTSHLASLLSSPPSASAPSAGAPTAPIAMALHGDKHQTDRDAIVAGYRKGQFPILVATDVAARGLDIPNIATVINFECPKSIETHVHRVGRTGRMAAGQDGVPCHGTAITLVTHKETSFAAQLVRNLQMSGQMVQQDLLQLAQKDPKFRKWQPGGSGMQDGSGAGSTAFGGAGGVRKPMAAGLGFGPSASAASGPGGINSSQSAQSGPSSLAAAHSRNAATSGSGISAGASGTVAVVRGRGLTAFVSAADGGGNFASGMLQSPLAVSSSGGVSNNAAGGASGPDPAIHHQQPSQRHDTGAARSAVDHTGNDAGDDDDFAYDAGGLDDEDELRSMRQRQQQYRYASGAGAGTHRAGPGGAALPVSGRAAALQSLHASVQSNAMHRFSRSFVGGGVEGGGMEEPQPAGAPHGQPQAASAGGPASLVPLAATELVQQRDTYALQQQQHQAIQPARAPIAGGRFAGATTPAWANAMQAPGAGTAAPQGPPAPLIASSAAYQLPPSHPLPTIHGSPAAAVGAAAVKKRSRWGDQVPSQSSDGVGGGGAAAASMAATAQYQHQQQPGFGQLPPAAYPQSSYPPMVGQTQPSQYAWQQQHHHQQQLLQQAGIPGPASASVAAGQWGGAGSSQAPASAAASIQATIAQVQASLSTVVPQQAAAQRKALYVPGVRY